ncbi:MAG: glycosyltransferase [Bacteroidetes bacterium]|nr:glycosyltransferase [Bacteroidota bacterium]
MPKPKKILVAPLDWGLGHAARCIPVIRELRGQGAEVVLASDGRALELLRQEFPKLMALRLPGYGVRYRTDNMVWNMGRQSLKTLRAIGREHRAIRQIVESQGIDGIISDNRFGCFSEKIPCVFLTHQLAIKTPSAISSRVANFFNHFFIKNFGECWVPDLGGAENLSGELSHNLPADFPKKVKYIGALSRMERRVVEKRYDVIAVLSGPEPQRTKFEAAILEQAGRLPFRFLIVQGKPEERGHFFSQKNIEVRASMTSTELNETMLASGIFVGRSGYSTVMDLAKLGKPALLVPTPGQTEQEYLADQFFREGVFFTQKQTELELERGLVAAGKLSGLQSDFFDGKALSAVVSAFLDRC